MEFNIIKILNQKMETYILTFRNKKPNSDIKYSIDYFILNKMIQVNQDALPILGNQSLSKLH